QPFELIVDYAHTPSSFETIFPPIRHRCKGKIISLFGSGGERDRKKRPLQGEIAAKFSDIVILTDEDPRGEDSVELLKEIAVGSEKAGMKIGENLFIIPDRPTAIREAFRNAKKDDIVLLLGKAHENSIIYKDRTMKYDEIAEAKKALSELGFSKEEK
ncbi:MAG: UDP-N-acetylmuramyl peptide synthase, partial [Treponema sp.]|nr:UDP-N-acetylmuramyl peptide synthase [Treponema sp.]